jgi:hypothetical protein
MLFSHALRSVESPTTERASVERALERLRANGGTATGEALASSLSPLEQGSEAARPAPAAIVIGI